MSYTRRSFLSRSALVGAGTLPWVQGSILADSTSPRGRPKRIIHLVADGMSSGTLACADQLSRDVRGRMLTWMRLYREPHAVAALMETRSLNSLVTDSAAASSSWGSGSRVVNGVLNMLPDGRRLKTLCDLFGEQGWVRGLVTTTEITHATPAGFAVNVRSRSEAEAIALQYLERRVEVLLGGGRKYFAGEKRKDKRDLKQAYRAWGYQLVENRDSLLRVPPHGRLLGLFASGHTPFTVDHEHDEGLRTQVPTLAEMVEAALPRLARHGHFLLQVEGGRVDHGAHASDAAAMLWDLIAFDEALDLCLKFQAEHGDTLIVVTTDHGNSNPGLNGMGNRYSESGRLLVNLRKAKASFGELEKRIVQAAGSGAKQTKTLADGKTTKEVLIVEPEVIQEVLQDAAGYEVPDTQARNFAAYLAGEWQPVYMQLDSRSAQMGQLLANHYGVGWTGTAHTSDHVQLVAVGPGADRFHGFIRNTDVFRHYTELAGIRFRNPEVPLLAESGPTAWAVEGLA